MRQKATPVKKLASLQNTLFWFPKAYFFLLPPPGFLHSVHSGICSYLDGPVKPERVQVPELFHKFGFTSLISMCDKVFSVGVIDALPAVSYIFSLEDNGTDLTTISASHIDWSKWGGLWRPGSGAVSPWNTHLGGEAFEPDGETGAKIAGFMVC